VNYVQLDVCTTTPTPTSSGVYPPAMRQIVAASTTPAEAARGMALLKKLVG
jgi:hypothetical protein